MGNKTERSKNFLIQAIQSLPNDFALSEARSSLTRGLREIERIEGKRAKRENQQPPPPKNIAPTAQSPSSNMAAFAQQSPQWTPDMLANAINSIDEMIDEEREKIEEIHREKEKRQQYLDLKSKAIQNHKDRPIMG
jgi:hypothetical protein